MSAYQFGWLGQPVTIDARILNNRMRALNHDFESGTIALTTRATEFKYPVTITSTTTPQLTLAYVSGENLTISVADNGAVTFNANGASAGFTFSDAVTVSALLTINSGTAQAIVATSTNSDQVQVRYDSSNYFTAGVSSAGAVTFNATGASAGFTFSDAVSVSAVLTVSTGGIAVTGNSGITGNLAVGGLLEVTRTSGAQAQFVYDGSNLCEITVASNGLTTINATGSGAQFNFSDDVNLASGKVLKVNGTQVVTSQGAAVADATDAASAITQLNALLARVRAHGLIAT